MSAVLQRETFQMSRLMEFFTERELTAQMGFNRAQWPMALLKELIDNALDAAESCGRPPEIAVTLEPDALIVQDNGPGLPLKVIERSLDYNIRVSDKLGYISPTRGQQGNALKTLWAAPFVATGEGRIGIETAGKRYEVQVTFNRIAQEPQVHLECLGDSDVKTGTRIVLHWTGIASCLNGCYGLTFYGVMVAFAAFNPHTTVTTGDDIFTPTFSNWAHWRPDRPTSPHWYSQEQLRNLIALLLDADNRAGGKSRSVNEFVRQFSGLSSTLKAATVTKAAGLHGAMLSDLINDDDLDPSKVEALLSAMQQGAKPIKPEALGVIGEAHCRHTLQELESAPESITYRCIKGTANGLPYVVEVAFGMLPSGSNRATLRGVNFSPALQSLFTVVDTALGEARVQTYDPVAMIVHLACPRVEYTDRGKTRAQLPNEISEALAKAVKSAAKRWTEAKRRADREDRIQERDRLALLKAEKAETLNVKEAAYRVMEQAYLKASAAGTLPANARQIMYAARPTIIELTGKTQPWKHSSYFTQILLPDFMDENPHLCAGWDVVFDARGHLAEPHTDLRIDIGTLAVRRHIAAWRDQISAEVAAPVLSTGIKTIGPSLRYRYALFIEKEGFTELLTKAKIAERFDIAIFSTKGLSTTAARHLVEKLSQHGVTILVLHDFDESGFKIMHTLGNDTRRYRFKTPPRIVDIGLRLEDVHVMDLQSENVEYNRKDDPRPFLMDRGATEEEAAFLVRGKRPDGRWLGRRVELNAMTSDGFIRWLERKFQEHGVTKFIPGKKALQDAWTRAWRIRKLNEALANTVKELGEPPAIPPDLMDRVQKYLKENPPASWDAALVAPEVQA